MRPKTLFLDLDECGIGTMWHHADRPWRPASRRVWAEILTVCEDNGVRVIVVTSRPAAQIPVFMQVVSGVPVGFGECGATAYFALQNRVIVNPKHQEFATHVRPGIMAALREEFGDLWEREIREETGGKLVTICIFPREGGALSMAEIAERARSVVERFEVDWSQGNGLDIVPKGASKADALDWSIALLEQCGHPPPDPASSLFIDDSMSAATAFQAFADQGGHIATVGNAADEVKGLVRSLGGCVADGLFEAGVLEALQRWLEA